MKIDKKQLAVADLFPHPLNREFKQFGSKWQALVASVTLHGVLQPPLVRKLESGDWQIVCGHRRVAAAAQSGQDLVECLVRKMTDHEALEVLVIENLEREDVNPAEESRLVRALLAGGTTPEELAARLKRSLDWISTRQLLLDLGEEVIEAVKLPRDESGHLDLGAVEAILAAPEEARTQAIQLVLHPEWQEQPLSSRDAAAAIRTTILEPMRKKAEWQKDCVKFVKAWKKRLGEFLSKEEKKELVVQAKAWEDVEGGTKLKRAALDFLDAGDAVSGEVRTWLHLALRHGLPVFVIPADNDTSSVAVVDEALLRLAEAAREENGLDVWIYKKPKAGVGGVPSDPSAVSSGGEPAAGGVSSELTDSKGGVQSVSNPSGLVSAVISGKSEEGDARVAGALQVLEGGGEASYQEEEPVTTVIEQKLERWEMTNLTEVRQTKETVEAWVAVRPVPDPPQGLPEWAQTLIENGWEDHVVKACDWMLSLKQGA